MKGKYFKESNDIKNDERSSFLSENSDKSIRSNYSMKCFDKKKTLEKWGDTFIRYRNTINSSFYIEKYIEEYIGETTCSIENVNFSFNYKKFFKKNPKKLILKHFTKDEIQEFLFCDDDYILRVFKTNNNSDIPKKYRNTIQIFLKDETYMEGILNILSPFYSEYKEKEKQKGSINIMIKRGTHLDLVPINKPKDVEFSNYTKQFEEKHLEIVEELQKEKGIILFYGKPGTGKTSYVKSLPLYAKNKKFIFVPPAFGDVLSSPEFLSFMINHKNSILIIEDAESALRTREDGRNNAVSNLLNITDGILQELLNIQVICTLNCNIDDIDEAIKRPGRLLIDYEFIKLSIEESNNKLKELYIDEDISTNEELSIAEIYNYKHLDRFKKKDNKSIGFKK